MHQIEQDKSALRLLTAYLKANKQTRALEMAAQLHQVKSIEGEQTWNSNCDRNRAARWMTCSGLGLTRGHAQWQTLCYHGCHIL